MAEEIPGITRIKKKIIAGVEIEVDYLEVRDKDIEKAKDIFDRIKKDEVKENV